MTRILPAILLTLACVGPAIAQTPSLPPGTEVRVASPAASGQYRVDRMSADTLTLRDAKGGIVQVPMVSLRELSVSGGRRSGAAGAVRGGTIGLAGGALSGAVIGYASGDDPAGWFAFTAEDKAVMLGVLLGGAGAVVGAIIGALAPGEQWEPITLEPAPAGLSDGGVAVGYAIRF